MCSEVAADLYTTKILKADVTVVNHGVLGGGISPLRYGMLQRDTPDTRGQGMLLSAGMARGWMFRKVIPTILAQCCTEGIFLVKETPH